MAIVLRGKKAAIDGRSYEWSSKSPSLVAGVDLDACTPVAINASGEIIKATSKGDFAGVVPESKKKGENATIIGNGVRLLYTDSDLLTPGALYYMSATAGEIDSEATANDSFGVFRAISTRHLMARTC